MVTAKYYSENHRVKIAVPWRLLAREGPGWLALFLGRPWCTEPKLAHYKNGESFMTLI